MRPHPRLEKRTHGGLLSKTRPIARTWSVVSILTRDMDAFRFANSMPSSSPTMERFSRIKYKYSLQRADADVRTCRNTRLTTRSTRAKPVRVSSRHTNLHNERLVLVLYLQSARKE